MPRPCWNGSPYQPVPVVTDTTPAVVLTIEERQEDYAGVSAESQTLRQYPNGSLAAHSLGYVGPVNQDELDAARKAGRTDLNLNAQIGRAGLEKTYDADLRGKDGVRYVTVDNRGTLIGTQRETEPERGDTLVTSIDRDVQRIAEQALTAEITKRRTERDKEGQLYAAPSGAAVVMDPRNGRVIALASTPTYDPTVFVGGISKTELARLTDPNAGTPLVSRAVQGQFAPGSTFKLSSASAEVMSGRASFSGTYSCPGSLKVGNTTKNNFEGQGHRRLDHLRIALAKSCDTIFYGFAQTDWYSDEARIDAHEKPAENLQRMARAYGFGSPPDIDLPAGEQTSGRIVDRAFKQTRWDANKSTYCADAKRGYPDVSDPARRSFLTRLAAENCTDGWRFQVGDAANLAIGQGETTVSPLQLAVAYSALVNGGTLWEPRLGPGRRRPGRQGGPGDQGQVPRQGAGEPAGAATTSSRRWRSPRPTARPARSRSSTASRWTRSWSAARPGRPRCSASRTPRGSRPGRRPDTPAQYVVVAMIEQAGLGAQAAAPVARAIYEGIYGLTGKKPAFPNGPPPSPARDGQPMSRRRARSAGG